MPTSATAVVRFTETNDEQSDKNIEKTFKALYETFFLRFLIFLEDSRQTTDLFLENVHLFSQRPWKSLTLAKL